MSNIGLMDKTRTIYYIEDDENLLDQEVSLAISRTMSENLVEYCKLVRMLHAMSGIDTLNYQSDKSIYYISDEH